MSARRILSRAAPFGAAALQAAAILAAATIWGPVATEFLWPTSPPDRDPNKAELAPLSLESLAKRPLFSSTRRPVANFAGQGAAEPAGLSFEAAFLVRGVISGDGGDIVILQRKDTGHWARLKSGDNLEGYRLDSVEPSRIVFVRDQDRVSLARPEGGSQTQTPP